MVLTKAHLADNVPVGEADNHPVLGCVVLVLILNNKALTSKEVGLSLWKSENINNLNKSKSDPCIASNRGHYPGEPVSLTSPPPEFDLVPLEVGLVLYHFYKTLVGKYRR